MKKLFIFGILFYLVLSLGSCRFILLKMYGIKDPKIENRASITKKAMKFGLDTTNTVAVESTGYLNVLKKDLQGIPDAAIFDANGDYIEYRKTDTSCNAGLFAFIPELTLNGSYKKTGKTTLENELTKFRSLSGTNLAQNFTGKADFYVLIYWTVYIGKLNKDHVKAWEDLAINNKNCSIKVIKVNLDWQAWWDKAEQERIMQKMRKK